MGEETEGGAAQRVPVELLLKIFGYLEHPTPYVLDDSRERLWVPSSFLAPQHTPQSLSEVARVCRNWLEAAKKAMYRTVLLRTPKEYENFMMTIAHDSTLASYVNTVLYECPGYEDGPDSSSAVSEMWSEIEDQLETPPPPTLPNLSYVKLVGDTASLFANTVFSSPSLKMVYLHECHADSVPPECFAILPSHLTHLHLVTNVLPRQTEVLRLPHLEYLGLDTLEGSNDGEKTSFRIDAPKLARLHLHGVPYDEVKELLQTHGHQIKKATILSDIADDIFPHLTSVLTMLTEVFSYCPIEKIPTTLEQLTVVHSGEDWNTPLERMLDELVQQKDRLSHLRSVPEIAFRHPDAWKKTALHETTVHRARVALDYFHRTRKLPFGSQLYLEYDGPILSLWSALEDYDHASMRDAKKAPDP